jgi:DNA-binding NtrC family response regulator
MNIKYFQDTDTLHIEFKQAEDVAQGIDLEQEISRYEIELIKRALQLTGGHQSRAARLLRMNPTTLNSKIKKYGIVV